jgi:hypothetical protein
VGEESTLGTPIDGSTTAIRQIPGVQNADIRLSSELNRNAPLENEEPMYIPAAQVKANGLALVHTRDQPSWIVRTGFAGILEPNAGIG